MRVSWEDFSREEKNVGIEESTSILNMKLYKRLTYHFNHILSYHTPPLKHIKKCG